MRLHGQWVIDEGGLFVGHGEFWERADGQTHTRRHNHTEQG